MVSRNHKVNMPDNQYENEHYVLPVYAASSIPVKLTGAKWVYRGKRRVVPANPFIGLLSARVCP